jgi:hypothetical protein
MGAPENRAMPVTLFVAVTMLNTTIRAEEPRRLDPLGTTAVVTAASPQVAQEADWQRLTANRGRSVALTMRSQPQVKGQMLSVEGDGLVVLSRDHPVRVDRKDVCDVMTYQLAGGRKARYACAFGVVGAGFGVMSWYAKNLGDQQNTNLAREVAIGGGLAALIGLATEGLYKAAPPYLQCEGPLLPELSGRKPLTSR